MAEAQAEVHRRLAERSASLASKGKAGKGGSDEGPVDLEA
jgi:hypothetical protein